MRSRRAGGGRPGSYVRQKAKLHSETTLEATGLLRPLPKTLARFLGRDDFFVWIATDGDSERVLALRRVDGGKLAECGLSQDKNGYWTVTAAAAKAGVRSLSLHRFVWLACFPQYADEGVFVKWAKDVLPEPGRTDQGIPFWGGTDAVHVDHINNNINNNHPSNLRLLTPRENHKSIKTDRLALKAERLEQPSRAHLPLTLAARVKPFFGAGKAAGADLPAAPLVKHGFMK